MQEIEKKLMELRERLIDLTGKSDLINFRHTKGKSLRFVSGKPQAIFSKLVESEHEAYIKVVGLPEVPEKDYVKANGQLRRPDAEEWAVKNQIPTGYEIEDNSSGTDVQTLMYQDDLAKHCRNINREATRSVEETGSNALFLALGFLEFPRQAGVNEKFTAPLICIPVELENIASRHQRPRFILRYTGEDITENYSLREKLSREFEVYLPEYDDEVDEQGEEQKDVNKYFDQVGQVIENEPGFKFKNSISLQLLRSTKNTLLYRDLDPNNWGRLDDKNILVHHPLVCQVLGGGVTGDANYYTFPEEYALEKPPGSKIPLVFDADSSQHDALIDVLEKKRNILIQGPPGTGKSQTISNLIAGCIERGQSVLFVAEKRAALDVVKSRLTQAGLDPFVLDMHTIKRNQKKSVLTDITARVGHSFEKPENLAVVKMTCRSQRDKLINYANMMNLESDILTDKRLHVIIWAALSIRKNLDESQLRMLNRVEFPQTSELSEAEFEENKKILTKLAFRYTDGFGKDFALWGFYPKPFLSAADADQVKDILKESREYAKDLMHAMSSLETILESPVQNESVSSFQIELSALRHLKESADTELPLDLIPRIFDGSSSTANASIITEFTQKVNHYQRLKGAGKVLQGDESAVTESDLSKLRQLRKQADELGAVLGTVHEMKALHKKLTRACDSLSSSNSALRDYFSRNEIPYNETEERIMQLYDLAKTFATAPRNLFYLQVPELAEYGAIENISRLHDLQKMHSSIEKELSENLHLDNLPSDKSIRDAARTLKRKKHWYHFFDKERRDSLLLHKDLERSERRTAILVRHSELVKIIKLIEIKEKLSQSPIWNQVQQFSRNIDDLPLRELLELAEWNQKIRFISQDSHAAHLVSTDFNVSKAEKLYVEFTEVLSHIETSGTALDSISSALVNLVSPEKYQTIPDIIDSTTEFAEILNERINWLEKATLPQFSFCEIITSCASAFTRSVLITKIEESSSARKLLGAEYKGISSDAEGINNVLNIGRCTEDHNLTTPIRQMIRSHGLLHTCTTVIKEMEKVATCLDAVLESLSRLSKYGNYVSGEWNNSATNFTLFPESLLMTILSALDEIDQLAPWASYLVVRKIAESNLLLSQFLGLLESKCIPPGILCDSFTYCMYGAIVNQIFEGTAELADFSSLEHEAVRNDFGQKDKNIISHRAQTIAYNSALSANPPAGMPSPRVASCTEMSLLRRLTPQTRMSLRRVLTQANESILALKPCFMMSPHDVAKYLRPAAFKFDVVIMDEASQLKIEETIGSVARANQLVVVGDPQQLPPARHWQNALDDGHGERTDSILSECLGKLSFRPLRWHYRSQHPSLIAFSNHHFYKPNRLILFPSPYERADNLGVHYVYLSDTAYDSNTNQNLLEAQRVVDAAIEHMKSRPQESLGIVTLNAQQRDLIEDLFEKDAANNHPIENYLKKWEDRQEKFFTKNLENVQGDERDAIFISTTFGKPQNSNDVSQNFGPISRDDGDRRLNVLFTRARKSLTLYTSLLPEDIRDNPTTPKGTKILREYLKYAKSGSLRSFYETGRSPESYFEQCVVDILIQNGYSVEPQLGVSEHGYRIDIAVLHPDFPHAYLVAIECDGAKYHSARSARDRDRIRQQVLESLGWKDRIWRIWSTEWFRNPERETKRLIKFIEKQRVLWDPRTAVIEDDGEHTESNGSGV